MGRGIGGHNDKGDKWLKNHQHLHSPPPSLILPACHFPCLSPCGGNQGAGSPISIPHVCYQRGTQTLVQILKSPASVQLRLYQASLSITNSQSLLKLMSIELVMPSNHLILCSPLLLLPSIFPSIRIFSIELAVHIRWTDASSSASVLPMYIQG